MPINLRYGQQAVARGFLNAQRLQQVLSKQKQLAEQGKKVSVRMILEKSNLLSKQQLQQIDQDLNIKVVKKHTTKVQRPGVKPAASTGAQDFAGEAVPQFSGMSGADPDATVFSPPPPDMQAKVRAERERAKNEARLKQEQEASAFFGDDASPFGGDPFGGQDAGFGGDMAPEPFAGEMQPEPFGGDMQPEPFGDPFGGEMQPEPMGFGDDPYGQQGGYDDGGFANEPQELSRMDSSPKLASLGAEYDGFANPEDEELPSIGGGFDDDQGFGGFQQPAARGGFQPPAPEPAYGGPALAPAGGDDFDSFGSDIRSPEELDSAPAAPPPSIDATMFSPPPPGYPGASPRQKTGAMDRTVFSPRPPEFGGRPQAEPQPEADSWGEQDNFGADPFGAQDAGFATPEPADNMDATLFSPPPAQMPPRKQTTSRVQKPERKPSAPVQKGRPGADDFGDVDLPTSGRRIDDVPTSPASMEDEVHPLRRGVGTSSASVGRSSQHQPFADDEVADDLPGADIPDDDIPDEMPSVPKGKGPAKLPAKAGKSDPAPKPSKRELPQKEVPAQDGSDEKKKGGKRVLLIFTFLLLVFVAVIVLPIALYDDVPQVRPLRDNVQAKPIYDYVDYGIMNQIREWLGMPIKPEPGIQQGEIPLPQPLPEGDTGAETGGETGAETGAETGGETDGSSE